MESFFYFILGATYYLIICRLLNKFVKKYFGNDTKIINGILNLFYAIYLLLIAANYFVTILPSSPDAELYTSIIKYDWNTISQIKDSNVTNYFYITYLFSILSIQNVYIFLIITIPLSFLGVCYTILAWRNFTNKELTINHQRLYLILALIYPALIYFSTNTMREPFIIFSFGVFLFGLSKSKLNIHIVLGILLTILLRKTYIILLFMFIISYIFYKYKASRSKKILILLASLLIIFIILNFITIEISNIKISPEGLAQYRNYQSYEYRFSNSNYIDVYWNNWIDIIIYTPLLILQFIISPIPLLIQNYTLGGYAYLIDGIYFIIIVLFSLLSTIKVKGNIYWNVNIAIFLIINSLYEFFLTGAVRHRMPVCLMLIVIASEYITNFINCKRIRKISESSEKDGYSNNTDI